MYNQPQGASLTTGSILYIFDRKNFDVYPATVLSVSQPHVSKAAQTNPALAFQGFVVEVNMSLGDETQNIEFPVNSTSASFPEKGWVVSPDNMAISREVEGMMANSRQYFSQQPLHEKVLANGPQLLMKLNPEKEKAARQAQEIESLNKKIEEMEKRSSESDAKLDQLLALLSGGRKKKEE